MSEKITLARIKKFGMNFEISVDPDKALEYKAGNATLREVLNSDQIFIDAKKGEIAKESDLQTAFQTSNPEEVADIILKKGEIQLTAEHRSEERKQKLTKLIHLININAVDPKTNLPHPVTRIELALEQAKVQIDYNKTIEEQLDTIIKQLMPILPISIQTKLLIITVPAVHAGKAYGAIQSKHKLLQDNWLNNGDWQTKIEVPAGLYQDTIDFLNSLTHGEVQIEEST